MEIEGTYNRSDLEVVISQIMPNLIDYKITQIFDEGYPKNVFVISKDSIKYVLKVAGQYEIQVYEQYLSSGIFPTPKLLGKYHYDEKTDFIMISFIEGNDLSRFCETYAIKAATSISQIHNHFFSDKRKDTRYLNYLKRIEKRPECLKNEPILKQAYAIFLDRQKSIPLTLCNGDYLPVNAMYDGEKVVIIDWGFSGYMPYALDVARMVAHGVLHPNEETFNIVMSDRDKELFLQTYFEMIQLNISEQEFRRDVLLAKLNEYIEFVEEDLNQGENDVKNSFYYQSAYQTALEIIQMNG